MVTTLMNCLEIFTVVESRNYFYFVMKKVKILNTKNIFLLGQVSFIFLKETFKDNIDFSNLFRFRSMTSLPFFL
jgi:hypothetical protein